MTRKTKGSMKNKIKHHWNENIRPALGIMLLGALLIVGMRLAEMAWPETAAKAVICFASDIGVVESCDFFKK